MISDVLPQLPTRTGAAPTGYQATALAEASPHPGETTLDRPGSFSAGQTTPGESFGTPLAAGAAPGVGQPPVSLVAPTTPQPVLGEATRYDQPMGYDSRPAAAVPPPDFSSWYDASPRSGSSQPGPAGQPGAGSASRPGAAPPAGGWPEYRPGTPRRRRPGLWWKIALVLLALLGAGAGAATIVLLRHGPASTPNGHGTTPVSQQSSPSTAGLPPASLQLVTAINTPPGPLPAGWSTLTHQASNGETAGFKIAYPSNWTVSTSGYQTYLRDPSANVNILVDLTPHTYPHDMLAEAQYIKSQSLPRFPGYAQIGLASTPIRRTSGSYWKFTWDDQGVSQEAIDMLFVLPTSGGPQSYALYFTAPASLFTAEHPFFDEAAETFTPLGVNT
jgi:hypothetical protein